MKTTDESGSYLAPFLIPGTYKVTVEKQGFKKAEQASIELNVNQQLKIDVELAVGSVTDIVEVTAAAPLVQATTAEVGQVIQERAVQQLPLNGRNFAQLVYLSAGVTPGQAGENLSGASTFNPRGASNYNALGSRANANGWLIDGIDNNEYTFNTVIVQPSLESVREFKVLTGSFSAEFGRGAGVVSVSTKSGTNDFHGTAFWFLRNTELDARQYNFSNREQQRLPFRRNQFGTAWSGPVSIPGLYDGKNRTFFFADYAGQREFRGNQFINTVPSALMRQGNFSEFSNRPIFDPATTASVGGSITRQQFPGNIVPANRINPVSSNLILLYPEPNFSAAAGQPNFNSVANRVLDDNQYTIRVDHQFSTKDSFFARFAQQRYDLEAPQGQAACCLPTPAAAASRFDLGPFTAGIQITNLKTSGLATAWTRTWSPSIVSELRAGYSRTDPFTVQSDFGTQAAESVGIRGINVNERATGLPNINVDLLTGLSGGPGFLPVRPQQWNTQVDYNTYWSFARHNVKFGYHVVRRNPSPLTNQNTRGSITFNNALTANAAGNLGGHGFASLLLGRVVSANRGFLIDVPNLIAWENAFFIQDDWRVSSRLTLNLGVRYEIYSPESEENDLITNFDRTALVFRYAGVDGNSRTLRDTDYNNFGPRFGFAYDVFGNQNTVVRGGYGLSYFPEPYAAGNMITQNAPNLFSQSFALAAVSTDYSIYPLISQPFGPVTPLRPTTTAQINAARPEVRGYDLTNKTQYQQTWTFNIQQQLGKNWVVEVGYAGSRGLQLLNALNINEVRLPANASDTNLANRRPIQPLRDIPTITMYEPSNMSTYHGGLLRIERRFANGFQILSNYTYGKSLDYGGSIASGGGSTGGPLTVTCLRCYRGPSGFDVKHRLVINTLYDLPFGKGRMFASSAPRALDLIIGGWQIGGILTGTTGRPFNVGLQNGVNLGAPSWPNRIADGRPDNPTPDRWFDPTAFVAPALGNYGNVSRGVLYSPGVFNTDFHMSKDFRITEQVVFKFRWEAFNLFNEPYFGFPNSSIGNPQVGRITSTVGDMRSMQFSARLSF